MSLAFFKRPTPLLRKAARVFSTLVVTPMPDCGSARRWKIERDRVLLGFSEKWPNVPGERHPYKVIAPAWGPGGARFGDMIEADYVATSADDAALRNLAKLVR